MQRPTVTNLRVRTARDAEILFHAVALGMLPMITRRLDSEERMALATGCVYVWEERTSVVSDSLEHGIERFTEGRSWGPSRARDDFLFYQEKVQAPKSMMVERTRALRYQEDAASLQSRRVGDCMIKQTYSVYINGHAGMKKWHLNAYWTQETIDHLQTIDDIPQLKHLQVPEGLYVCARTNRMRDNFAKGGKVTAFPPPMVTPYPPYGSYPQYPQPSGYGPPAHSSTPRSRSNTLPSPGMSYISTSPPSSRGSWSPSPLSAPAHISTPIPSSSRGLALAPLDQLRHTGANWRRDPTDEQLLRSLDRTRW
ncbi:unnamed protein product [Peniophora sp. CBMAI 1063]|nr:unnamed protein product [Peniophora sp. CBMAI 1063]